MEIKKMTREEKVDLVRRTKTRFFSLRGKSMVELKMVKALEAACEVLDDNEAQASEAYSKGFLEGRLFEAKQARLAQGDTEIVGEAESNAD